MSGKGSAPRPYSVPMETFDQSFERIFGKRKWPDQTHRCDRCGKPSMPGHIHTCSPQIKEKADDGKPEPSADMR